MLKLTRLGMNNFFSHKESNINLSDYNGLILISGVNESGLYDSNGSGKSTVLEGIVYAVSGNTLRNVGVNDVVNRNVGKDTCVSLEFSNEDSKYRVERYRKDKVQGNAIKLYKISGDASEDISKRLNEDTQEVLDNIIGIPYKVLVNTIFLGEGLSSKFTQLSDPDKKFLIESTLNLSYDLNASKDKASQELKSLRLEKSNLEGQLSTLNSLISEDIENLQKELAEKEESLAEKYNLRDSLSREISDLQSRKSSIEPRVNILQESIFRYKSLEDALSKLDEDVAILVQEVTNIESSETPLCTLCHQPLESIGSRDSVISNYKERIQAGFNQMKDLQTQLESLPSKSILESKYNETIQEIQRLSTNIDSKNNELISVTSIIAQYLSSIPNLKDIIQNQENYNKSIVDINTRLEEISHDIERYEYFYKLFSPTGILTNILEEALSYINTRISVYSELLLDKSYRLRFNKGKISLEDSTGTTYQSLSNGEKRRLDIAIQFSLHDYTHVYCGIGVDTLLIDEILDTLDATGVSNILEILNIKKEYCNLERIFVITHNNELKSYFDEILTVKKLSDGNSYID